MFGFVVSFIVSEDFRITRKELGKCADARKYDPVFFSDRTKFRDLGKKGGIYTDSPPGRHGKAAHSRVANGRIGRIITKRIVRGKNQKMEETQ